MNMRPAVRALYYARAGRPSTIEALTVNNDRAALEVVKKRWYAIMAAAGKRRGMETDGYLIIDS